MDQLKEKYDLDRMMQVVTDRLNDFEEHCNENEYGKDYKQSLIDTVKMMQEIAQGK